MPRYEEAPKELTAVVSRIAREQYPALCQAGVTVKLLLAFGEGGGPAIKHHGWPAAGLIRRTNQRDRVAGLDDAIMILDGDQIGEWSHARTAAVIDHELMHLEVVEKMGQICRDGAGRPRLKMRPHDAQLGVFFAIMERHGRESIDLENVTALAEDTRQWIQPVLNWN